MGNGVKLHYGAVVTPLSYGSKRFVPYLCFVDEDYNQPVSTSVLKPKKATAQQGGFYFKSGSWRSATVDLQGIR